MKKSLIVFCFEYNPDSVLLSHSFYWIQKLKKYFEDIRVVCVRSKFIDDGTIKVYQLGGGSFFRRILGMIKLFGLLGQLFKSRKRVVVFHHMILRPLAILGWSIWMMRIPQTLWYSHSKLSLELRFGYRFLNSVVTPTRECFPIQHFKNIYSVGHGVDTSRFRIVSSNVRKKNSIVVVGRISRIKNLEAAIFAIAESQTSRAIEEFIIYGPSLDLNYNAELVNLAKDLDVKLTLRDPVTQEQAVDVFNKFNFSFNGNPRTVDKAAIEAALCGVFVFTTVNSVQELSGMSRVWKSIGVSNPTLSEQILSLTNLSNSELEEIRRMYIDEAFQKNNLDSTIEKIAQVLTQTSKS